MSIYFQYPAIDEYPVLNERVKIEVADQKIFKDDDVLYQEQIKALRDFLELKLV